MLTEETKIDLIEIVNKTFVQVRSATTIFRDGEPVGEPSYHRKMISPGDDYNSEDALVKDICELVHTPQVVSEYKTMLVSQQAVGTSQENLSE